MKIVQMKIERELVCDIKALPIELLTEYVETFIECPTSRQEQLLDFVSNAAMNMGREWVLRAVNTMLDAYECWRRMSENESKS